MPILFECIIKTLFNEAKTNWISSSTTSYQLKSITCVYDTCTIPLNKTSQIVTGNSQSYYEINDSKKLQNTCFQIDAKKHLHISSSINYKCIRVTENLYFSWQLRKQGGRNGFIVKIMRQLVFHYSLEFRPDFVDKSKYM